MEFLLVFVCCLVLALSVLGMIKCVKETTGHQRQQDIINVAENIYVMIRQGDMKKCNVVEMTAFLLKLGKSTVLKYYKKSVDEVSTPGKTRKKRPQEGKSVGTIDDFTMNAIRNAIYRMYSEGLHVTVDTVFKEIQDRQIDFYGGRTTLHKLLKKMEFSWTIVDGRKAMIENENIVLQRIDFLRKYKEGKEKGANFIFVDETWIFQKGTVSKAWQDSTLRAMKRRSVGEGKRFIVVNAGGRSGFVPEAGLLFVSGQKTADYHGEMNGGTFLTWLEDMLVHLEEPSIIVMDNASYHSTQLEKTPTTNWSKGEIIEWLEKRNINHQKNLLKVELLRLAKVHKPQIRYEVDEMARSYGHEVLRLPPYHCHYNAIELVWAQCKRYYNSHVGRGNRFDNGAAAIWKEALDAVTPERWENCIDHVEKIIQADWEREVHVDIGCKFSNCLSPPVELKQALLVSKFSRYELERLRYPNLSTQELERKMRKRGSDFDLLIHHHNVHKDFEKNVEEVMKSRGIEIRRVNRFELAQADVDWADFVFPLGGDGTFLMVASSVTGNTKPVVGFNSDPTRSEGHLCLPKTYSSDVATAIEKLQKGQYGWMFRSRIRTTLLGEDNSEPPIELQEQVLAPVRSESYTEEEKKRATRTKKHDTTRVLPFFALNEVFIGECLSARVSYFELSLDDSSFTKVKSSGLCVTTGTGSTSWHLSMNRVDEQTVNRLGSLLDCELTPEQTRRTTNAYNASLVFSPEDPRMSYTIRDHICAGVWPNPKGIEPRGFASQLLVKSHCFDAGLVIDGRLSFKFNDGSAAKLEICDCDALRTVILND